MRPALVAALVLALAGVASAARLSDVGEKNRPVSKVINLLKDMVAQMEKEGEEDEEAYETMGCWCETNDKGKTKAIADGESRIANLQASIEELTGKSSQLNTEIKNLETEVAKHTDALDGATAMRSKQLEEFNGDEKSMLSSIGSLGSAVATLSKHNAALVQLPDTDAMNLAVSLKDVLRRHRVLVHDTLSPMQLKAITAWTQAPFGESSLVQADGAQPVKAKSYQPASNQIFGILGSMKESFETNLAASQKEEMTNQNEYEDLKAAKTAEIAAANEEIETKTNELGETDEKNAADKEDLEDTEDTLAMDTKFLADLKVKCANIDAEYEERQKNRQAEIQAVSKALEFLSSDEAHDLFTRTFNPEFLQVRSSAASQKEKAERNALVNIILTASKKVRDPRLSQIMVRARLDKFEKVKQTIQDMVDKLIKEKEDDIKHKDYCIESFNQNERDTAAKDREKEDLLTKIDDLTMTIDTLEKAIEGLKAEVADLQLQMKAAGEEREKLNKEFQVTVADQRATQKLLGAALKVLKGFYEKGALIQRRGGASAAGQQPAGPPPPPGFKTFETNAASGGVMGMMEQIIDDAKSMEAEAIRAEEDSQATYETFVHDTQASTDEAVKDMTNKMDRKSKAEVEKVETEVMRDKTLGELEALGQDNADLHKSCDFLLKNFDLRVTARDEEVDALKQGIAMFSGASFGALLQHWDGPF